jgi:CelD/BcsL family acetyltransferase involved in cellulose biosynthesis
VTGASRKFDVLRSGDEFAALEDEWTDLLSRSENDNVFLTWEWLRTWWEVYGSLGRLLVVTVRQENRLVAAAPLCVVEGTRAGPWKPRELRFLGTLEVCSDFVDIVVDRCAPPSLRRELLQFIRESLGDEWDLARFDSIPADSPTIDAIRREFSRGPIRPVVEIGPRCPFLPLPVAFDALVSSLEPGLRKALLTSRRKLEAKGILEFRVLGPQEPTADALIVLMELHAKRWGAKGQAGVFRSPRFRQFHERIADRFHTRGWLFLSTLTVDGAPVAARYGFLYHRRFYDYQGGFDPAWSKWSVGLALYGMCLNWEIEQGAAEHDFLRGQNPMKARWTARERVNARIRFGRLGLIHAVVGGSEFAKRRVAPILKKVLPGWAVEAIQRARMMSRTASEVGSGSANES